MYPAIVQRGMKLTLIPPWTLAKLSGNFLKRRLLSGNVEYWKQGLDVLADIQTPVSTKNLRLVAVSAYVAFFRLVLFHGLV